MSIDDEVTERGIFEIIHFTSNHGLVGALEAGAVLSRRQLPQNSYLAYIATPTAAARQEAEAYFDKQQDWLDFVNLSISEINHHYFKFASQRWHVNGDRWWAILSFSPEILSHSGVWFTTTNNTYEHVSRDSGLNGIQNLFRSRIRRKGDWFANRGARESHLTTCQQAEVLYPGSLSLDYLRRIYVVSDEHYDLVVGWLRLYSQANIDVIISPEKFAGRPN